MAKIYRNRLISDLDKELKTLDSQINKADKIIGNIASIDLRSEGLKGQAFSAVQNCIDEHKIVVQAQYSFFSFLYKANIVHREMILKVRLSDKTGGYASSGEFSAWIEKIDILVGRIDSVREKRPIRCDQLEAVGTAIDRQGNVDKKKIQVILEENADSTAKYLSWCKDILIRLKYTLKSDLDVLNSYISDSRSLYSDVSSMISSSGLLARALQLSNNKNADKDSKFQNDVQRQYEELAKVNHQRIEAMKQIDSHVKNPQKREEYYWAAKRIFSGEGLQPDDIYSSKTHKLRKEICVILAWMPKGMLTATDAAAGVAAIEKIYADPDKERAGKNITEFFSAQLMYTGESRTITFEFPCSPRDAQVTWNKYSVSDFLHLMSDIAGKREIANRGSERTDFRRTQERIDTLITQSYDLVKNGIMIRKGNDPQYTISIVGGDPTGTSEDTQMGGEKSEVNPKHVDAAYVISEINGWEPHELENFYQRHKDIQLTRDISIPYVDKNSVRLGIVGSAQGVYEYAGYLADPTPKRKITYMQAFLNSAGDDLIDLAADKMVAGTNYFAASATPAVEALAFVFKMFVHANSKMLETNAQVAAQAKANYNSNLSNIISNNAMFTGDQISMSMIIGNNGVPHYKWSWDENTLNRAINAYSNIHPENQITMERFKNAMDTEPDKVLNYQIKAGTEHDLQTPPKNKYGKFLLWASEPAHVVYRRDVFDGNRLVHRRGERFEGKISNYEYVIHRDSAYEELEFVSDPAKGK